MTTLREIVAPYGLFFVDQFGVLRGADAPYPGAVEALKTLRAPGRTVVILSNSGKRAARNEERLVALGFPRDSFDLFLTSGEVVWRLLSSGAIPRPQTCFVISRDEDTSPIDGLGIAIASDAATADMILIAGSEAPRVSLEEYRTLLEPAARLGVPTICANPDMTMLVSSGTAFGAGRIARLYEELGGQVTWIGKPYPEIYAAARAITGTAGIRALGIGDSIEHDIAGAKSEGSDAALVLTGIHADATELEGEYRAHGVRPEHVLDRFVW